MQCEGPRVRAPVFFNINFIEKKPNQLYKKS